VFVIATFICGDGCEVKMNTVVVHCEPSGLDEVVDRLSAHSCYFESGNSGYADLIIAEGRLVRCELLPEVDCDDLKVLTVEEFRPLWDRWDRIHAEAEQERQAESARAGASDHAEEFTARARFAERRAARLWRMPETEYDIMRRYVIATFVNGDMCETKMDTVVLALEPPDTDEVVQQLSMHSCYYQACRSGYVDLIVVDGRLVRCELVRECDEVGILDVERFRSLWREQNDMHRWIEEELALRMSERRKRAFKLEEPRAQDARQG
jgi:hypothetical protein